MVLSLVLLISHTTVHAEAPEYQVKAAMLANFALFVEWPSSAYSATGDQFIVCVVGGNPFGLWLEQEMGEMIGDHPVAVRTVSDGAVGKACSIVFISQTEQQRLKEVLASLRNLPVLTVSDVDDPGEFCRQGGMIALVKQGKKVRFELNSESATKAGLKIDSKLKRIAQSTDCGK